METSKLNTDITSSYNRGKQFFLDRIKAGIIPQCSVGYVSGSCKSGHRYAAVQFCGKEYCPDCGRDGSPIHQRRVNKWFRYVQSWDSVGYLVVTIPADYRHYFYNQEILKDFRFKLLRLLKEKHKITKGLARYHYFGDCVPCNGKGCMFCKNTGAGTDYYPHLNILIDAGYIPDLQEWLKPIKSWMKLYFKKLVKADIDRYRIYLKSGDRAVKEDIDRLLDQLNQLNNPKYDLVLNYSYVAGDAERMNKVKYITRSTFRHYHKKTIRTLYNFRNSIVWGWKKENKQDREEDPIYCPICAKKGIKQLVHWHSLTYFEANQTLITYDKRRKKPLHEISSGDLQANSRCRRAVPIVFRKATGKVPTNNLHDRS